jgi:hypothetical protein
MWKSATCTFCTRLRLRLPRLGMYAGVWSPKTLGLPLNSRLITLTPMNYYTTVILLIPHSLAIAIFRPKAVIAAYSGLPYPMRRYSTR